MKRYFILTGALGLIGLTYVAVSIYRNRGIELVKPKRGDMVEAIYGLGKVKSNHRFDVKIGVMSTVDSLYVREGDFVKSGAKLISLESASLFRAPFDGTVTLISAYQGEIVTPQVSILRLEDLQDRYIELSLEQQGALRVKPGQLAKVSFESLSGKNLEGKVTALFSKEDEFLAHIQVENLDSSVLPGMTADVSVEVAKISNALLIPLKAIHHGTVVVHRKGRRQKVPIEVGHVDGTWAEVKDDSLTLDDEIVLPMAGN